MRLRLLDLDGSLPAQPCLRNALHDGRAQALNLRDIGPDLRLWAKADAYAQLRQRLHRADDAPGYGATLTMLGSGDYHNLTPLLLERQREPVTLIHFDNHPDWVRWAPRHHCGSWVNRALELPQVWRVITLGPCSDDLHQPHLKGGNLAALREGRLETYPWQRPPTRVPRNTGDGAGHRTIDGRLHWTNLADIDLDPFIDDLVARMPTRTLWITVDKDVLRAEDAATNWDQGAMPLSFLLRVLRALGRRCRVVGADICGEYAPPQHCNWLKRIEAWRDQPRVAPADLQRNHNTNYQLISTFQEILD
jgi:arginase family enzyme